jgi:hypothetical protein
MDLLEVLVNNFKAKIDPVGNQMATWSVSQTIDFELYLLNSRNKYANILISRSKKISKQKISA